MNKFVDFINQFYSQNASQNSGYAELTNQTLEGISLAISGVIDDVKNGRVDAVILTGNAGDGKTYLCKEIFLSLTGRPLPNASIHHAKYGSRNLCVIKDASEVDAGDLKKVFSAIENRLASTNSTGHTAGDIYIIAGNEGKVSDVLYKNKFQKLQKLFSTALRAVYDDEREAIEKKEPDILWFKIINFNWRALTHRKAFDSIVNAFVNEKNWESSCTECPHSVDCPIYFNVRMLRHSEVKERTRVVFNFFRCLEGHFTLRELFSALSYIITGNLNCCKITEVTSKNSQFHYTFYNNMFSRNSKGEEILPPQDRLLKEFQKYDPAYAPLTNVNKWVREYIHSLKNKSDAGIKRLETDLQWIYKSIKKEKEKNKEQDINLPIYDAVKRRVFFLPSQFFWGDDLDKEIHEMLNFPFECFLPFPSYREFDEFINRDTGKNNSINKQIRETIIKGLNLLANRYDKEADLWLKVHKPHKQDQAMMELVGDQVEFLESFLSIEVPYQKSDYLEFLPMKASFSLHLDMDDNNKDKNKDIIRLKIDLKLFEGLRAAALGNQSRQNLGELERVIDDFREVLFYRLLKNIKHSKFILNTGQHSIQLLNEPDRLILRVNR
jgi:hypothetical protein